MTADPLTLDAHRRRRSGADTSPAVPFALCADDYGLTPGIGEAVRRLVAAGRLTAVSCLVTQPIWPAEAAALRAQAGAADIGLHLNLSLGRPLAAMPDLAADGRLPRLPRLIARSLGGRIDRDEVAGEIDRQIDRFTDAVGRPPDFIDGHEHVHQFPQIRDSLLAVAGRRFAPGRLWIRRSRPSLADLRCHPVPTWPRALAIALLGGGFAARAAAAGFAGNRGFRGVRRFRGEPAYAALFAGFVAAIPAGGLVMCHPGLGTGGGEAFAPGHPPAAREAEYRFLMSDAFADLLGRRRLCLVRLGDWLAAGLSASAPASARRRSAPG